MPPGTLLTRARYGLEGIGLQEGKDGVADAGSVRERQHQID